MKRSNTLSKMATREYFDLIWMFRYQNQSSMAPLEYGRIFMRHDARVNSMNQERYYSDLLCWYSLLEIRSDIARDNE